jgi:folate-binding protein YgfZ
MSDFINFLKRDTPAKIVGGRVAHFGDTESEIETAQTTTAKCPLLSLGIVAIAGTGAQTFVNGQFTTNCTEITVHHSQLSGWCDPKGRVLFLFTLYTDGERIYAILPKVQITDFMRRLQMYILRADVQLEDLSNSSAVFGYTGAIGSEEADITALKQPWGTAQLSDATIVIRQGPGPEHYMATGTQASGIERWKALGIPNIGEEAWTALECFAGLPRLDEQTSGKFLPQNLNLDRLDAVSFSKGCYPGQEIIARLKFRGEVKKRLIVARLDSTIAPEPGTPIRTNEDARAVGNVLYSQRLAPSESVISAVVAIDAPHGTVYVEGAKDGTLRHVDLPYGVD